MVGVRNNPYWTGSYDPVARRFDPDRREPRFVDLGLYYCVNPHLVDGRGPDGARAGCCSVGCWGRGHRSTRCPTGSARTAIPRVLELAGDELVQSPVPEIETLRGPVHRQRDLAIVPNAQGHLEHVAGDAFELELTVDLRRTRARRFGTAVRVSRDGRGARVWYEPAANRIGVDRLLGPEQAVDANPAATRRGDRQGAVAKLQTPQITAPAGTVTLRLFVGPFPSWRCTAAAPRSPTACIPMPRPPASTCSQRAEWRTSRLFPYGRCASPSNRRALAPPNGCSCGTVPSAWSVNSVHRA